MHATIITWPKLLMSTPHTNMSRLTLDSVYCLTQGIFLIHTNTTTSTLKTSFVQTSVSLEKKYFTKVYTFTFTKNEEVFYNFLALF